ncbi:MAG TPA: hypothetical protein PL151_10705 [Phycisphaerae bacterium]|nr:hypothetical protein [Phycisphaerae bacterium]HOJ72993.1 hypothetical protein [Phycisphaerae bacterium]HOM50177.1 hypothetical protein [Phycisphaerae bacterium]HON67339.1 hypothetical protein [Phycisphaerae bacterium]HOQ84304.1 hypothetical protein [Phycisphaerae bacterium]
MRYICAGLVLVAMVGVISPGVARTCCAQTSNCTCCCCEQHGDEADASLAVAGTADEQHSCPGCPKPAPRDESSDSSDDSTGGSPQSAPKSHHCNGCGVLNCAKTVVFFRPALTSLTPAPVDFIVITSEAPPASLALNAPLRPPRSA